MILGRLIPNLHIELLEYGLEKDERSSVYNARVELLSCKDDRRLPLRVESAGTLKIFSVISALIAFYKQENACVVIDELDAGIFEYLLGEILESLQSEAKGQLIFTSHNLRALEVLPIKNIWFTTVNAHNRYTQMKYVREVNNTRNRYYEAIQVDGLPEKLYVNTDISSIKRAFRKAGRVND
nr:AAA family ATPase [Paenibacillus silagei]